MGTTLPAMAPTLQILPGLLVAAALTWAPDLRAGYYDSSITPLTNVPWPGGVVPYEFDAALTAAQQQAYLDGLKEYELAADVEFRPKVAGDSEWILFKYDPGGPNLVSGSMPQVVEINLLTRGQICHEMGHSFGLMHEHQRPDRDSFITILYGNIDPGNHPLFDIDPGGVTVGPFEFDSVMHYGRNVLSNSPPDDTIQPKPGHEKWQTRLGNRALSPGDRATMALLYGPPATPLSPVVTTTADGGPGSLRAALYHACDNPGSTVTFNIPVSDPGYAAGVFTISLTGALPPFGRDGISVDATTQPGYAGKPLVFLDGSQLLPEAGFVPGLLFYESGCSVMGLGVRNFPWAGLAMLTEAATGNSVSACWSGLDSTGTAAAPNTHQGLYLAEGAHGNTIGSLTAAPNIFSGNQQYGLYLTDPPTRDNIIQNTYLGTDWTGTAAVPNQASGAIITGGATNNTIGPASVLSGNAQYGLWLSGMATTGNILRGCRVGTTADGSTALPNALSGAIVTDSASGNTIGPGNIISGNTQYGLIINGTARANSVVGNIVGYDAAGSTAVPNALSGIALWGGAWGNSLGPEANLIAGNTNNGIALFDVATTANSFRENSIFDNGFNGIFIGSSNNSQAAPTLTGATHTTSTRLTGSLASTPSTSFELEFFASLKAFPRGGRFFVGSAPVTTDGAGNATFDLTLPAHVPIGRQITATASSLATGDTSEFSASLPVSPGPGDADGDGDGLPESYESAHGLSDANPADATDDHDGDGHNALAEFIAGTDPQDRRSRLVTAVQRVNGQTQVVFSSHHGTRYRVDASASPAGPWTPLALNVAGTGGVVTVDDPDAAASAERYYRLTVEG